MEILKKIENKDLEFMSSEEILKYDIVDSKVLSKEEAIPYYQALLNRNRNEEAFKEAVEVLVYSNLRLVNAWTFEKMAEKLTREWSTTFMSGLYGLFLGILSYDYTKGEFSTHVYQYMYRYLKDDERKGMHIVIPDHKYSNTFRLKRMLDEMDNVSIFSNEIMTDMFNSKYGEKLTAKQFKDLMTLTHTLNSVSVDSKISDDSDDTIGSVTADTSIASTYARAEANEHYDFIYRAFNSLDRNEKEVIFLKYGLFNSAPHSDKEVSQILGISTSRVKTICNTGYEKMKYTNVRVA